MLFTRKSRAPCGPLISTEFFARSSPVVVTSTSKLPTLGVVYKSTKLVASLRLKSQSASRSTTKTPGMSILFFMERGMCYESVF